MPRRQRTRRDATLVVLVIPWWLWLAFALGSFAAFQWLAYLPRGTTGPDAIARGLWIGFGYVGRVTVPLLCLLIAVLAFIAQHRRPSQAIALSAKGSERPPDKSEISEPPERDLYAMWKDDAETGRSKSPDTSRWNLDLLRALEWKRLEQLCALYFRALRFRVQESEPGPDGGIDLRLFAATDQRAGILVQCKAWNTWKVGVKEIRELFGVMASEAVSEGIFVTTSTFTTDAVDFARGKNIALIDGDDLLRKLLALAEPDQMHILRLATAGDFMTPTCASCGDKMIERTGKDSGRRFWGCPRFPACRTTLQMSNFRGPSPG